MAARAVVIAVLLVVVSAAGSCSRAEAQAAPSAASPAPAPPAPAPPAPAVPLASPPRDELWTEVAKRIGVAEAKLRACKQTSDCASMPHFTRCCSHVALAKDHVATIRKGRAKLDGLQTKAEADKCSVVECSGATSPVACMQGWCVLDPYRATFEPIAKATGLSPEDLRACTNNEDCDTARNPAKCCDTIAIAKTAHAKVRALGDTLMTKHEREGCAIKKCGGPSWVGICNDGMCQTDFAP